MYLAGVRVTTPQARLIGEIQTGAQLRAGADGGYELVRGEAVRPVYASVVKALVDKGLLVTRPAEGRPRWQLSQRLSAPVAPPASSSYRRTA